MEGTGGILDLGLDEVELDAQFVDSHPGIATGRFVRLTVKDTGCGMTEEVKARIFEPYFTTRQSGEGTGMGLAVVHGVVHSRGGTLSVASTPGQGTTFQVFLPVATLSTAAEDLSEELPPTGSERILLIDDEPILVDVASRSLARLGYKVTPMTSSLDAVERFKTTPGDFDVVVTDMTMPKMTGDELAAAIRTIRPDIPIILCSGYSERLRSAKAGGIDAFAYKPVAAGALSRIIRKVMQDRASR
jgi:CheY-like chemotaxis protein